MLELLALGRIQQALKHGMVSDERFSAGSPFTLLVICISSISTGDTLTA